MVGEAAEKAAWKKAGANCRDLSCPAHGRMLRRIRRLVQALVAERRDAHQQSDKADYWHAEFERVQAHAYPMDTPVLDIHAEDQEAEAARYAAAVERWHLWSRSIARDERAMGWERAHTTMCSQVPCREHRNPWQRSRG